jgi:hypothetical protein
MKTLAEVTEATALMNEAVDWSVMKWLTEKKRVRKTADRANDALWAMQKEVKARWNADLRIAYDELGKEDDGSASKSAKPSDAKALATSAELRLLARHIKDADDEAWRAHMDAEATFEKAEKILSTSMAREGCRKAIHSWELYAKAILASEAAVEAGHARQE